MSFKKFKKLSVLLCFLSACGTPEEQNSTPSFQVGGGSREACTKPGDILPSVTCMANLPGHEILTRQAMDLLDIFTMTLYNDTFTQVTRPKDPPRQTKGSGFDSVNRLVRGNFAQDKILPMAELNGPLQQYIADTFGVSASEDWQDGPNRQRFHSLRDFRTQTVAGADTNLQTCHKIRNIFYKNAEFAIAGLKKPSIAMGEYARTLSAADEAVSILGAATHTLQDSFSHAHIERNQKSGPRFLEIQQFCTWGYSLPGVCRHWPGETVGDDAVGHEADGDIWPELANEPEVMKPEARHAANTTAFYLAHVYRAYKGKGTLDEEMEDFYNGSPKFKAQLPPELGWLETGLFDCKGLQ